MKKNILTLLMVCAVTMSFVLVGCGKTGSQSTPAASQSTLSGVAFLDTAANGTVSVKDSSVPAQEKTAAIKSNGDYTVDVSGLKPPFMLKAVGTDQAGNIQTLHSVSKNGGRTNINPISDTAVAASADTPEGGALSVMRSSDDEHHRTADNFEKVIYSLRTVLAPLYSLYNISGNAVYGDDDDDNDNSGLRAMLRDVRFVVNDGKVTVTNRQTGGIIFKGSLRNLSAGTFSPENMPAGPGGTGGSTACTYAYSGWGVCQADGTQTRTMTSSPAGCTGTPAALSQSCTYVPPTASACAYTYGTWGACQSTGVQIRGLVSSTPAGCTGTPALTQSCTYVPPVTACNYVYSTWGACQANGTQTRTMTSSPAGCTGTPAALSQTCTYVPPVTACNYVYSTWGACQANGTQTRTVTSSPAGCTGTPAALSQTCTYVPPVTACNYVYSTWGACQANGTQTRTMTSSPAGCTGTPAALSQTCTYVPPACTYTYNAWGACQSNNTQTRTTASASPAGCAGTPVLSQSCTYVPPVTTCTSFTYSAWGACQSNNTQTRTVSTSSPAGCTGGTRVLTQACTYVPPTPTCGSCHAIPPTTGHHTYHYPSKATCSTCHGTGYSPTAVTAATHQNGVKDVVSSLNFNATTKTCSPGCHGSKTW